MTQYAISLMLFILIGIRSYSLILIVSMSKQPFGCAWSAGVGPSKDLYNIGDNPQFTLEVVNSSGNAAVWILLTRHITDREDFANNKEYITILVYKNDGKKVYIPFDPPPYIDGTRINSPHYLCKMTLNQPGTQRFTLVVSQYEKSATIKFSLRVYATVAFSLSKIRDNYSHRKKITGEWKGVTAGGCANYRDTCKNNPIYQVSLDTSSEDNELCIDLKGPKQYSVGFDVIQVNSKNNKAYAKQSTSAFRPGFQVLSLTSVPAGVYNIIPQTFRPAQEGPFFLQIQSSCPHSVNRLQ